MKAQILTKAGFIEDHPLKEIDVPIPEPGPGEVRMRVLTCGVCHTDLHLVEGEIPHPRMPIIPGHQIAGVVDKNGPGSHRFHIGQRIGYTWLYNACGQCIYCLSERENLCVKAEFTGQHHHGGYAEYALIREDYAQPLPDSISDEHAAPLLCAGVIGYRSLQLSEIKINQRLGLFGFGASAHIAIQIARYWDCEVYVFTRSEHHRQLARELGAVWAGNASDDPGVLLDNIILFAPSGRLVHDALRNLAPGGTIAINAIHMSPIPELPYESLYHERALRSVANLTRRDARELLTLAADIPIQTEVETFALEEANMALRKMKHSELRAAAVLKISSR